MDCRIVYEKINSVLLNNKDKIPFLEYATLQSYIDLLFSMAQNAEGK